MLTISADSILSILTQIVTVMRDVPVEVEKVATEDFGKLM